jgi:hypothetical protein
VSFVTPAAVFRAIQLILAPVVMITSCGIIVNGLLTRYGAISDRMREMARERLDLVKGALSGAVPDVGSSDAYVKERLTEVDYQLPLLLRRHRMLRDSLQAMYLAILVFVLSMVVFGVAAWVNASSAAVAALLVFLAGQVALVVGLFWNVLEIRTSDRAVEYEVQRVQRLHERDL